MSRRGQMSPFMLGFILALVGFVILAAALLPKFFNQGSLPDREACHLSVLARGTLSLSPNADEPSLAPIAEVTPLKCTTDKICITDSFLGKCSPQFDGESRTRRVRVDANDPAAAARVIERETANAMYDCWTMMGEGQVDLFAPQENPAFSAANKLFSTSVNFDITKPRCVVCSRIAVDATTVPKTVTDLVDVNRFMAEELVPGQSETYLHKFTDKDVNSYAGAEKASSKGSVPTSTNELAIVFMQIKTNDRDPWDAASDVAAGSVMIGGGGLLTSVGRFTAKVGGLPLTLLYLAGTGATAGYAAYAAHESQMVAAGYCGEFTTESEKAKLGCSLVRPIAWNANEINSLCSGGLEGNL